MRTTICRLASSRINSGDTLPPDLDPKTHRIIAQHYFGVDLRAVRETWWSFAREGVELPAQKGVILLELKTRENPQR